jgi:HAE1 family hydrophobic/amphiphilic exporter-1
MLEAGPTRLRPILMTSFTIVFALLPTALQVGEGSDLRAPLAAGVLGGVATSTLLTLLLIPVVYSLAASTGRAIGRLLAWRPRRRAAEAATARAHGRPEAVPVRADDELVGAGARPPEGR